MWVKSGPRKQVHLAAIKNRSHSIFMVLNHFSIRAALNRME